ncbi:hypothetical protein GM415_00080 [Pseudodesulfovibrio cashew]|uniref:Uncharacterized protein n=1 Tax=Pseudodesulfovibrio cashew TaxID=2678688 RepID=A0A6I6J725_9BACT|nr:hypothetical protein [Pseudodesulfovibrio cashew]QGY38606.1 hypothetical protein GM415_00080 [Pseudodesulfovibrio cashew]
MSKHFKTLTALFCLLGVLLLLPAGAHCGDASDVARRAEKCGVSAKTVELVRARVDAGSVSEAQADGLLSPLLDACVERFPLDPMQDKLAEGLAKHVPALVITRALLERLEGYRFARELLLTSTGTLDSEALVAVAEGVGEGVPRDDFKRYVSRFANLSPEAFRTGVIMTSLQGQAGFDFGLTSQVVEAGIKNRSLSPQWRYLVRIILAARRRGIDDPAIAAAAVAVLEEGGPVSSVMAKLGFTGRNLSGRTESE